MRLLLVEDDPLLGDGLCVGLGHAGFTLDWVQDGLAAERALAAEPYALMLLDLGLPRLSGLDLLKNLRRAQDPLPVLILTARDSVADRIRGLDGGADDYLVKPFDLDELAARVRALLRRAAGRAAPQISHQSITIDPAGHRVTQGGQVIDLSPREFAILLELMENRGRVLSRERLEQGLYGWGEVDSNTVEVYIHHLRKKLGAHLIRTLRGVGYLIDKP